MSSERQENNEISPWWGEHVHRYNAAMEIIPKTAKILDIACGSGFGSKLLAEQNYHVVGADISKETIDACKTAFQHPRLKFEVINATQIPYETGFFDAVVSFETIEHTREFLLVLNEFKRVTKKDGVIVLSTPNFPVNSPGGRILNPYHTQEWTYEEFLRLLHSVFRDVKIYGQAYCRYRGEISFSRRVAKAFEYLFYLRGIRKIPIKIQDAVIKMLSGNQMYPTEKDYCLADKPEEIKKCKTFFAICKG
jgi:2-polyprenyl-3-methyl-5-hydroxy-6-metoxy-1,4-benzoquinol methylase